MKTIAVFSVLVLGVIALLPTGLFQLAFGPHGGKVKKAENFNIEKIQSPENLYVFLLDSNSKPMANTGITGEVRFYFLDETTSDIPLIPFEKDGFVVKMNEDHYHACRISFIISGKSISAKFDNENLIVINKNKQ